MCAVHAVSFYTECTRQFFNGQLSTTLAQSLTILHWMNMIECGDTLEHNTMRNVNNNWCAF